MSLLSEAVWNLQNAETVPDEKTEFTDSTDRQSGSSEQGYAHTNFNLTSQGFSLSLRA